GQKQLFPNGIPECGTDALRYTLCSQDIKNHFIDFDINICHSNTRFFNKIWQATKFTITSYEQFKLHTQDVVDFRELVLTDMDRYILSRLSNAVNRINKSMNSYNLHIATDVIKRFLYGDFCDVYLVSD